MTESVRRYTNRVVYVTACRWLLVTFGAGVIGMSAGVGVYAILKAFVK